MCHVRGTTAAWSSFFLPTARAVVDDRVRCEKSKSSWRLPDAGGLGSMIGLSGRSVLPPVHGGGGCLPSEHHRRLLAAHLIPSGQASLFIMSWNQPEVKQRLGAVPSEMIVSYASA